MKPNSDMRCLQRKLCGCVFLVRSVQLPHHNIYTFFQGVNESFHLRFEPVHLVAAIDAIETKHSVTLEVGCVLLQSPCKRHLPKDFLPLFSAPDIRLPTDNDSIFLLFSHKSSPDFWEEIVGNSGESRLVVSLFLLLSAAKRRRYSFHSPCQARLLNCFFLLRSCNFWCLAMSRKRRKDGFS
jgi:hypothetical protein